LSSFPGASQGQPLSLLRFMPLGQYLMTCKYWQTNPDQRLDTTHIWHPAQFSTRYQSSPKENKPSTSKKEDSPDLEDDNSSVSKTKTEVFPNPDTIEPTHTSPGENIAAELVQAPIFLDITKPTKEDLKGKSQEAYLLGSHHMDVVEHNNSKGLKVTDPQRSTTSSLKERELRS